MRPSRSPLKQVIGATILLLLAGVGFIPAYLYWNGSIQRSVAALPTCGAGPRFEFNDQAGRPIGTSELSGVIWVASFLDLSKPSEAELLSSKLAELDQNFRATKALTLVSFFIGAEKRSLAGYGQRYEASDRWRLVSVREDGAATFIRDWTAATAGCRGELQPPNVFVIIDRRGQIRGVYDAAEPEVVQKILTDAGNLLRVKESSLSAP